jgi:hypothetical protein
MGIEVALGALIMAGAASWGAYEMGKGSGKKDGGQAAPAAPATPDIGNVGDVGSVETQAAQRRLARMSKYFTSPTGVMGETTGSAGVF